MTESKFEAYLKLLKEDTNSHHDYDILFGSAASNLKNNPGERTNQPAKVKVPLQEIYGLFSKSMGNEVKDRYFSENSAREERNGSGDNTETNSVAKETTATVVEVEAGVINHWCGILETALEPNIPGIFSLSDQVFEKIFANARNLSIEDVERLTMYVSNKENIVSGCKIDALAFWGLMPKMIEGNFPLRSLIPIFRNFISISPATVIQKILFPMYRRNVAVPRPLLNGIDKLEFLTVAVTWMKEESVDLSTNAVSTLTILIEGQRRLQDGLCDNLISILEQTLRMKPDDKSVTFFLRSFVSTFGPNLKEEQLVRLKMLNDVNQTDLKTSVQNLIEKYLDSFS